MHNPRYPALERPLVLFAWLSIAACSAEAGVGSADAGSGSADGGVADAGPLLWTPCREGTLVLRCATLAVPMDYSDPEGPTINLALARLPASDPSRRIGSLLYNPGGPGVSGRSDMPALVEALNEFGPSEILARFDIVTFDPRGVPRSTRLICGDVPGYQDLDWSPDDDVERMALEQAFAAFHETCEAGTGPLLGFLDSWSVARDMDEMRRALGEERLTFLGFSYGTLIGAAYADIFPERVRALVLDAAVEPTLDAATWMRERVVGTERAFDAFAADCAARPACAARFVGGDIRIAFDDAVRDLAANPLVNAATGETMDESILAVHLKLLLIQLPERAPEVESFVERAAARDVSLVGSTRESAFGQARGNVPFLCLDYRFAEPLVVADLVADLLAAAPRLGHADLPLTLPCAGRNVSTRLRQRA